MATLVSTGQITIIDNNDARPITAYVTASNGVQQVFTKDEDSQSYLPDWTSANNTLTAKVYVGGTTSATEVSASLTNRKWSNDLSTSIGANTTYVINTNMTEGAPNKIYYFEGDYVDPTTGLISHIIAQIQIGMVKTGTNAVYVLTRGKTAIEEANGVTKNVAVVATDLVRAGGIDTTGVTYKFYDNNGVTQITNTMTTEYGLKTTAVGAAPTGSATDIGVNLPAAAAWSTYNTLIIHETAVTDMGVYRVEAKDNAGTIYQTYFTIYDVTDPYDVQLVSTAGDKLQNGVGNTDIYPTVRNGSTQITDFTGWSFKWIFYDGASPGNKAGFVDTTRTAVAGGRSITANTIGAGSIISYSGAAITFAAGDMVKIVTASGEPRYYEVASGTTTTNLTLRTATVSTFLNAVWPATGITASQFVGGKLFVCSGTGATAGTKTTTGATGIAAKINVTGDEIDTKGTIFCEASRP